MYKVLLLAPMASVHERFNKANIDALKKLNCEIHLAADFGTDDHAAEYGRTILLDNIKTHSIHFTRASLLKNLASIPEIRKLLKKEKFDVVHCHTETGGILTRLAAFGISGTSFMYTPHGMSFYKGSPLKTQIIYRPIERFICGRMAKNIAMNSEELCTLQRWNRKTAVFVHGAGVDLTAVQQANPDRKQKCSELGINPEDKILLSIGELNDNKNHATVIEAISLLKEKDRPQYLICGTGDGENALKELAEELGVSQNLTLAGYRYDIPEIVKIADAFVFPSFHEGLSVALMQAMAAELPVVCSNISGNTDLIDNGSGGFVIDADDAETISKKLTELFEDEEKRKAFGQYNGKKVKACSLENVTSELVEIYSSVLTNQ